MKNLAYFLALHSVDGLGPIRLKRVLEYFEDPELAWKASSKELHKLGIPINVLENLREQKKSLDPEKYFEEIKNKGIKVLTIFDENYPELLKEIYNPPLIIFYKGEWSKEDKNSFGVVGTRKITGYGKTVTAQLTEGLVQSGFTIVSGLARGVDTIAHQTALDAGGRTIAVLAGGINTIFPPQNTDLARKIADGQGLYMSEFPPDYPHLAGNFPSRNRIISGLSKAVLVTEAAEDSGSLITARLALDQGREVFAVPGPITSSLSKGPAELIKQGAKLVYDIKDILEEMGLEKLPISNVKFPISNLSEVEKKIMECLENENRHIDELVRSTQNTPAQISAALIKMEILGLVKSLGGGNYIKS